MSYFSMSKAEYGEYVKKHSPDSRLIPHLLTAFAAGGLICVLGQALTLIYGHWLDRDAASTLTSITLIFLGAVLTGLGVYDDLALRAGAGTLVPITGFANSIVSPAIEFKTEGLITGASAKMFVIAGPVIVWGVSASVVYGVILWALSLLQ